MSGGTQNSLRKALGALKDTTTVSLAKVNSDYKVDLDFNTHNLYDQMLDYLLLPMFNRVSCFAGIGHCYS